MPLARRFTSLLKAPFFSFTTLRQLKINPRCYVSLKPINLILSWIKLVCEIYRYLNSSPDQQKEGIVEHLYFQLLYPRLFCWPSIYCTADSFLFFQATVHLIIFLFFELLYPYIIFLSLLLCLVRLAALMSWIFLCRCALISDMGIGYVSTMASLQKLYLRYCQQVRDLGVHHIYSMRKLRCLSLAGKAHFLLPLPPLPLSDFVPTSVCFSVIL